MGVLIIHGFAGNPKEVMTLSNYLQKQGYFVSVPLLPGHGQKKDNFKNVRVQDWVEAVKLAYLELEKSCDCVFVVGFSMGGLLGAQLWNYNMAGLVTVNTPVYYWNFKQIAYNLFSDVQTYGLKYIKSGEGKSFGIMVEFQKLLMQTKPLFRRLQCNAMILQLADDDTVLPRSAEYIFHRLRGKKRLVKLPKGGHQIFQNENAGEACLVIESFFREFPQIE